MMRTVGAIWQRTVVSAVRCPLGCQLLDISKFQNSKSFQNLKCALLVKEVTL
jgi:hypothetical protein